MIAIPDFAAGAMENWGLITYRETALLYDRNASSESNKQRVAMIIAHELAHQVDLGINLSSASARVLFIPLFRLRHRLSKKQAYVGTASFSGLHHRIVCLIRLIRYSYLFGMLAQNFNTASITMFSLICI